MSAATKSKKTRKSESPKAPREPKAKVAPKAEPKAKAPRVKPDGKMSLLDAAVKILGESGEPMNCQEMVAKAGEKGYWTSPAGRTPHATLYSAILMEIKKKGKDARFVKTIRGKFALANAK